MNDIKLYTINWKETLKDFNNIVGNESMQYKFMKFLIDNNRWYSTKQILTWKLRLTKSNIRYCQLAASKLKTDTKKILPITIRNMIIEKGMLPTPTTNCYKGGSTRTRLKYQNGTTINLLHGLLKERLNLGSTTHINPHFVEEMMGYPKNWTNIIKPVKNDIVYCDNKITHASLFSGICGFDLAAQWCNWENKFHCEINPFGANVLNCRFPNSKHYENIKTSDFTEWNGKIDVLMHRIKDIEYL